MLWQDARKIFEQHQTTGDDEGRKTATGMLSFVDKLGDFFDAYDIQVSHLDLCINVPDRNGRVVVSCRPNDQRFTLTAEKLPLTATQEELIDFCHVWNLENPAPEIEEFIERVKPEMAVGWK